MIRNIREARACLKAKSGSLSNRQKWILEEATHGGIDMKLGVLREAIGSDVFDALTLDASHNSLIAGYNEVPDQWRPFAIAKATSDYKTVNASALSGIANPGVVGELQEYPEAAQLDEKVSYPIQKRGQLLRISMEAKAMDALGALNQEAAILGRGFKTGLNEFVIGTLIDDNPTCDYDAVALINSSHSNTTTATTLNEDNLQTLAALVLNQTGRKGEQLYLNPTILLVPPKLAYTAQALIKSALLVGSTTAEKLQGAANPFLGNFTDVFVSPHVNGFSTTWYYVFSPSNPVVEVSFLNGRQEPEIVMEPENTGSSFSRDAITWKGRFPYGGDVIDHRGIARSGS